MEPPGEVTRLLQQLSGGNAAAMDALLPLLYTDLHAIAARYFQRERREHTLQPTALVNEAYLRLAGGHAGFNDRLHFLAVASIVMRRILVSHARRRNAIKRPDNNQHVPLYDVLAICEDRTEDMLAIDESLTRLQALDPQQARLVELRFFGGLSVDETAAVLSISPQTVKRRWNSARAWLRSQMTKSPEEASHESRSYESR